MEKDELRLFHIESGLSSVNTTLLSGVFLVGIALLFGATTFQIGLLTSIPFVANIFQILSSYLIERTGRRKAITLFSLTMVRLSWVVICLIALGLFKTENKIYWLLGVLFLASVFGSIGNLSLTSWISKKVPEDGLARFFSRRHIAATLGGIIAYIVGSVLISKYHTETTFGYIFLAAVILGIMTIPVLWNVSYERTKERTKRILSYLKEALKPMRSRRFRPFLIFVAFWSFAVNFAGPFFLVYMLKDLGLSFVVIASFLILSSLARIYSMRIWGKMGDVVGAKSILLFGTTIAAMVPFSFLFINQSNAYALAAIFMFSAFSFAAVELAMAQLLFKIMPRKKDSVYLSSFYGIIGIFSALGPIAGGALAAYAEGNASYIATGYPALFAVFGVSFLLRVSAVPMIKKIMEREARDIKDVVERIKDLGHLSFIADFYDIADVISQFVLVPQEQLRIIQKKAYSTLKKNISDSIKLSQKAIYAIGRATRPETILEIGKGIHQIAKSVSLPRKYSESKAIKEIDDSVSEAAGSMKNKKKAEEIKTNIKKKQNILKEFFDEVILLKDEDEKLDEVD
jgi:MFS family permease